MEPVADVEPPVVLVASAGLLVVMEEDLEAVVVEELIKAVELVTAEELVLVALVEALVVEVLDAAFTDREKPPVLPVLFPSPE